LEGPTLTAADFFKKTVYYASKKLYLAHENPAQCSFSAIT